MRAAERGLDRGAVLRVLARDDRVRPPQHVGLVGLGHADHQRDRTQRDRGRDAGDEVATSVGDERRHPFPGRFPDHGLEVRHGPGRERRAHQAAVRGVHRRVHRDEDLAVLGRRLAGVARRHGSAAVREAGEVARDRPQLGVGRHHPVAAAALVPPDRVPRRGAGRGTRGARRRRRCRTRRGRRSATRSWRCGRWRSWARRYRPRPGRATSRRAGQITSTAGAANWAL